MPRIHRPNPLPFAFVLVLLAAALPAHAQTVEGRTVDGETRQPVPDASVALVDTAGDAVATVRSAADGTFRLRAPAAGEYRVTATRLGYRTMLSNPVALAAGQAVAVEAPLTPQPVALETATMRLGTPAGISGRVLESRGDAPIAGATVRLLDARGLSVRSAVTDEQGRFHVRAREPGTHYLRAQRSGYGTATSPPITVAPGDTLQVEMRLAEGAVVLAPLTVVAASRDVLRERQIAEFEWRRTHQPWGRYMGPEDVARIAPFYASDVLQQVPFVKAEGGRRRVVTLRGPSGRGRCSPTVYVDGRFMPVDDDITVDEVVAGTSVAAVEVYERPALAPAEFYPRTRVPCGVVVIWTRPAERHRG